MVGISTKHFDESLRRGLSAESVRGDRRALRFYAPDVVAAWIKNKVTKLEEQVREARAQVDDPLLAAAVGGDSVGLERYRLAKAQIAEWEVQRLRGELVAVAQVEGTMMGMAQVLRRYGEILAKRFGDEAAAVMSEAVDEWVGGTVKLLRKRDDDGHDLDADSPGAPAGDGGKAAADPVDAAVR